MSIVETNGSSPATTTTGRDTRLELAREAAVRSAPQQDTALADPTTRATGVLSAAAVAVGFSASSGLFNGDPAQALALPVGSGWSSLLPVIVIGGLCLAVLRPVEMCCGAVAAKVPGRHEQGDDLDALGLLLVGELSGGRRANTQVLRRKFVLCRWGDRRARGPVRRAPAGTDPVARESSGISRHGGSQPRTRWSGPSGSGREAGA